MNTGENITYTIAAYNPFLVYNAYGLNGN